MQKLIATYIIVSKGIQILYRLVTNKQTRPPYF